MMFVLHAFKALADETRLRLLTVLLRYELSVKELVELLGMGQSRVSRHLKILSEAGLLAQRRDGLWVFYSAVTEGPGRELLQVLTPFLQADAIAADVELAGHIIEERARTTRQFFNTIAGDWDKLSREILGKFDLAGEVVRAMPDDCGVAVDLGCGTGAVLERMRPKARQVIGVDGSSSMLELSRQRFAENPDNISLRIGELEHLPLRDGESDFVCINMVLHHLSEPQKTMTEVRRVIRPGGLLLVTEFDRHDREQMRRVYGDQWLGFEQKMLEELLVNAGFVPLRCERCPVEQGLAVNMILARNPQ